MRIEEDVKLDFKDVLFRPKRSTLRSRSEVDLKRSFVFRNSHLQWSGVPVMASNMDTVGTFEVFNVLKTFENLESMGTKDFTDSEITEFKKYLAPMIVSLVIIVIYYIIILYFVIYLSRI